MNKNYPFPEQPKNINDLSKKECMEIAAQAILAFSHNEPSHEILQQNLVYANSARTTMEMANGFNVGSSIGKFVYSVGFINIFGITVHNYNPLTGVGIQRMYEQYGGNMVNIDYEKPSKIYCSSSVKLSINMDTKFLDLISVIIDTKTGELRLPDGGHRLIALFLRGVKVVQAKIYYDLTEEEEGEIFCNQYKGVNRLKNSENFFARCNTYHDGFESVVNEVCKECGVLISGATKTDNCLSNFKVPVEIVNKDGGGKEALRYCLKLLSMWEDGRKYEARFLNLANFLYMNGHKKELCNKVISVMKNYKTSNEFVSYLKSYCNDHEIKMGDSQKYGLGPINAYLKDIFGYGIK